MNTIYKIYSFNDATSRPTLILTDVTNFYSVYRYCVITDFFHASNDLYGDRIYLKILI